MPSGYSSAPPSGSPPERDKSPLRQSAPDSRCRALYELPAWSCCDLARSGARRGCGHRSPTGPGGVPVGCRVDGSRPMSPNSSTLPARSRTLNLVVTFVTVAVARVIAALLGTWVRSPPNLNETSRMPSRRTSDEAAGEDINTMIHNGLRVAFIIAVQPASRNRDQHQTASRSGNEVLKQAATFFRSVPRGSPLGRVRSWWLPGPRRRK